MFGWNKIVLFSPFGYTKLEIQRNVNTSIEEWSTYKIIHVGALQERAQL